MNPLAKSTRLLLTAACLWVCFKVVEPQQATGSYQCMRIDRTNHGVTINVQSQYPRIRVGVGKGACASSGQGSSTDPHVLKITYNLAAQTTTCEGQFFSNGTVVWIVSLVDSTNTVQELIPISCNSADAEVRFAESSLVNANELPINDLTERPTVISVDILSDHVTNKVVTENDVMLLGWTAYFRIRLAFSEASSTLTGVHPYDVYVSPDTTFKTGIQMLDSSGCTLQTLAFKLDGPFTRTSSEAGFIHTMTSGKFKIRTFIGSRMLYFKMRFDVCVNTNAPKCILSCQKSARRKRDVGIRNDTWYYTALYIEPNGESYINNLGRKLSIEEECFTDMMFLVPNVVLAGLICLATLTAVYFFFRLRKARNKIPKKASSIESQRTRSTTLS